MKGWAAWISLMFYESNFQRGKLMKNNKDNRRKTYSAPCMCLGMSLGIGLGIVTDNLPILMPVGLGIGLCIGILIDMKNRKKD